jgi:tetratricopeptide (TPR) repeat protein
MGEPLEGIGTVTDAELQRHNDLFTQATTLLDDHIILHDVELPSVSSAERTRICEAQRLLAEVVGLNPANWSAMWFLGKACERLGEHQSALDHFAQAHLLNPGNPDVAREATIAAIRCSRPALAIQFATAAWQANQEDVGLAANLALAHLFGQNPRAAKALVEQALAADPQDTVTRSLAQLIDEVLVGTRACPTDPSDIGLT